MPSADGPSPTTDLAGVAPDRPSLRHGRTALSIPGPSVIPDAVLQAMHAPMPNIYEGDLIDLSLSVFADLPAIARTEGSSYLTISNGHGAWEMALTNTLSRGQKVLVLESGRFAIVWGDMAATLGLEVEVLRAAAPDVAVDPAALEARLADDTDHEIAAILVVQVDTATSVRNDVAALRQAIDAAGHPALFMVDCIASMGCERFEMDDWGVDVTVAASQKGLMVPPGLGLVWANDAAHAAHESADLVTGYWSWTERSDPDAHYKRYAGTPPISHLFGMRAALDLIAAEGLENVWARHEILAGAVHAAVEAWSAPDGLGFYIGDPGTRSFATTTVRTNSIDVDELRRRAEVDAGLVLGLGIGAEDPRFRIGHMGHLNPPMLLGTLGTIEAVLTAMGAPMGGSGVAAAAAALAPHL